MVTLVGVLVTVIPFTVVIGLLAWMDRRERTRREVTDRQIALTDVIHERVGAIASPVVRRLRRRWQVRIAVPYERPDSVGRLLAIVLEAVAPTKRDPRPVEIVLTRQQDTARPEPTRVESPRRESLSWS